MRCIFSADQYTHIEQCSGALYLLAPLLRRFTFADERRASDVPKTIVPLVKAALRHTVTSLEEAWCMKRKLHSPTLRPPLKNGETLNAERGHHRILLLHGHPTLRYLYAEIRSNLLSRRPLAKAMRCSLLPKTGLLLLRLPRFGTLTRHVELPCRLGGSYRAGGTFSRRETPNAR